MPSAPAAIDRVSVGEDQAGGQLVRAWVLTALVPGGAQVELARGESLGNRRIVTLAAPLTVAMVTLNVTAAAGPLGATTIRELALYAGCGALAASLG